MTFIRWDAGVYTRWRKTYGRTYAHAVGGTPEHTHAGTCGHIDMEGHTKNEIYT